MTDVGNKGLVDVSDAEQKVGRALEQCWVDVRHDSYAGDDSGFAVNRDDVPGPARDLNADEHAITALRFGQHVWAGGQLGAIVVSDLFDDWVEFRAPAFEY